MARYAGSSFVRSSEQKLKESLSLSSIDFAYLATFFAVCEHGATIEGKTGRSCRSIDPPEIPVVSSSLLTFA